MLEDVSEVLGMKSSFVLFCFTSILYSYVQFEKKIPIISLCYLYDKKLAKQIKDLEMSLNSETNSVALNFQSICSYFRVDKMSKR